MKSGFVCLFATMALAGTALAQRYEISPTVGAVRPSRSDLGTLPDNSDGKDDDTKLKIGRAYGARATYNTRGYYGFEGMFLRSQSSLSSRVTYGDGTVFNRTAKINVDYVALNALCYFMPLGEWWRPFVTAGAHTQRYGEPQIFEWTQGAARTFGFNFGGGLKFKLGKHAGLRLDFRDYVGGKPYDLTFIDPSKSGGLMHSFEGTVGLSFRF